MTAARAPERTYTVRQVADMASLTVRALHHYDALGLLTPSARSAAGYRLYGEADLLRLQQILFFRELGFPLEQIRTILEDPHFDQVRALEGHREMLALEQERLARLIATVDKTLASLTEDNMGMTDEELYAGFSQEQIERYKREAREKYGEQIVEESERRVKQMPRSHWEAINAEGEDATQQIAALAKAGRKPGDPDVQAQVARHFKWVTNFWQPDAASYAGLGQMYSENDEFRAHYEKYGPNMAEFMRDAMKVYSETSL
jgi:DNA-binding transcriptional MerR regulator